MNRGIFSNISECKAVYILPLLLLMIGARAASRTILKITYGYTAKESGDPIITIASLAMDRFMKMLTPGAYPVDLIPAC